MARLTFDVLADQVPELRNLLNEALEHQAAPAEDFCNNAVFYGYPGYGPGFKPRLCRLVGWESGKPGVLGTAEAYDVVYDTLADALPDCRGNCACVAIMSALGVKQC